MHVVSSITITAPDPRPEPARRSESKSMLICIIRSAGMTFMVVPPGMTPFSFRPSRMPPANASSSGKGVPSGTS